MHNFHALLRNHANETGLNLDGAALVEYIAYAQQMLNGQPARYYNDQLIAALGWPPEWERLRLAAENARTSGWLRYSSPSVGGREYWVCVPKHLQGARHGL